MNRDEFRPIEEFVVNNKDLEKLESLIANFNIFETIGAVRQELRHSDFLSFILNPSEKHSLGDGFLKHFLKQILVNLKDPPINAVEIDVANLSDSEVRREWRNIDILVHSPSNKLVCAVENKVGSQEHTDQTKRYRETLSQEFPDHEHVLIFLTPEGDQSKDPAWIPCSYSQIADLVDEICNAYKSTIGTDINTLMRHYSDAIRRHVVSSSEIAELCRKVYRRHKGALDLIFEHRPDLQMELFDYLKSLISESGSHGIELDHSTKSEIRFADVKLDEIPGQMAGKGWTPSGRILLYEFRNNQTSLSLKFLIGPGDQEIRKTIFDCAKWHKGIFKVIGSRPGEKWTQIYKRDILKFKEYQETDLESLSDRVKSRWSNFLDDDFQSIRKVILNTF